MFILSVLVNGVLAKEYSSNMKVGDERKFKNKNYQSLEANFKITDKNNSINLKPEVRVYDQPQTITSEADIESTLYSDNFLVFNILKNDGFYNVRYQIKPFMIWIWISIILISFGGILSIVKRNG